jgi:hypothetical protein
MYAGTCNDKDHKFEIATNSFEKLLNHVAALTDENNELSTCSHNSSSDVHILRNDYNMYEGTGNSRTHKNSVASSNFEELLTQAIFLKSENKTLSLELRDSKVKHHSKTNEFGEKVNENGLTRMEEIEDSFLYDDGEFCEMDDAADFARYG